MRWHLIRGNSLKKVQPSLDRALVHFSLLTVSYFTLDFKTESQLVGMGSSFLLHKFWSRLIWWWMSFHLKPCLVHLCFCSTNRGRDRVSSTSEGCAATCRAVARWWRGIGPTCFWCEQRRWCRPPGRNGTEGWMHGPASTLQRDSRQKWIESYASCK